MPTPLDLTNLPDADVVTLAKRGREPAFREIVRRYEGAIYSVIQRIVQDRDLAEDLSQDTFVKVFKSIDKYRPEFKLSSWLFRIAHNVAIDHLRKREHSFLSISGDPDSAGDEVPRGTSFDLVDKGPAPDASLEARELGASIEQAIRGLRPVYRSCVILRFIEGRSYEEIATTLDLPLGTIKTHIHRAREELKEALGATR